MSSAQPPHLVVFTGAGISAESGIQTFRADDGLWADYRIEDVATPDAWERDPETVLHFYDLRRDQIRQAKPNTAHKALAALEKSGFQVSVITQNIDDLHERAGSTDVLHLHGEVLKARSSVDSRMLYPLPKGGIRMGDVCDKGSQLRPDVVWFGEAVPRYAEACEIAATADLLLVVGTSLAVMPAAMLVDLVPQGAGRIVVDPAANSLGRSDITRLALPAGEGVPMLTKHWLREGRLWVPETLML
ncbi:MAG: SIR2 family NAD-dependent protein deacylase [Halomonas sp.]|uniref:SIR2 family NAD-dependent protein deacylase n=1 Tax=Halomonas sp. TaxID=1486246 RepID=UPI003F8DB00E